MMINPTFLRTFQTLVEVQSFTRTAELLNMTQPGVSQHLKWLEEYFGARLIDREQKTFMLTESGQRLITYTRDLFAAHEKLRLGIAIDDPHKGLCRFASPGSFGIKMYTQLLKLNARYRDLAIHFAYAPNPSIERDVLEDKIDVGFVTKAPEVEGLVFDQFEEERLCLVVPKSLRKITWPALMELGFINHPDGFHHTGRLLARNFPDRYVSMGDFPVRGFINQVTRIPEPVALGLGFTALPEFACRAFPDRDNIRIDPLKHEVIDPIFWIQKRGRQLPARFKFIREQYK